MMVGGERREEKEKKIKKKKWRDFFLFCFTE
jgi:hypothetical protein